jgi:hypothetical protein
MIGGGASRGGEGGIRKSQTPLGVNKDTIESSHDGRGLLIRPGKLTVKEGDFKKAQLIDEVNENRRLSQIEIVV